MPERVLFKNKIVPLTDKQPSSGTGIKKVCLCWHKTFTPVPDDGFVKKPKRVACFWTVKMLPETTVVIGEAFVCSCVTTRCLILRL